MTNDERWEKVYDLLLEIAESEPENPSPIKILLCGEFGGSWGCGKDISQALILSAFHFGDSLPKAIVVENRYHNTEEVAQRQKANLEFQEIE